ncbi:hypothetical protein NDU88_007807 [Pleurodeles waltl]|uniref:Uncharacterized protein n=1 Tax=Pleurodeles waltl TaxID=8319 RepID=A0AAV7PQC3_PLEWA|nr:hypothetical protein NDU88_007807 [Pleurodeles waltl]
MQIERFTDIIRLSIDPAQDTSDWRWPRSVHGGKDGLPRFLDDTDAGTHPRTRISGFPREQEERTDNREETSRRTQRNQEGRRAAETTKNKKRRRTTTGGTGTARFPEKQPSKDERGRTETRLQTATPQEGRG